jgi:Tol biopolymer transport system component
MNYIRIFVSICLLISSTITLSSQNNNPLETKVLHSSLEVYDITNNQREILFEAAEHFEAPNWATTGEYLLFNQEGGIIRFDLATKERTKVPLDFAIRCNNDHGISPDGKILIISHNDMENVPLEEQKFGTSKIYTVPISGGKPVEITPKAPSYWHGVSPNGKELAFVGRRNGQYDIYTIDTKGGKERQITDSPDLDDGPDYSPDGKYIYYNSYDSESMEIWRMETDGSNKEQLTDDSFSNWFAHPNPNGQNFVFISYDEDQGQGHPPLKKVTLKLFNLKDGSIRTLCKFTGGQGTINVPSWSPDGTKFAFVTYEMK